MNTQSAPQARAATKARYLLLERVINLKYKFLFYEKKRKGRKEGMVVLKK